MWILEGVPADWPIVESLKPIYVLDEYDGPRLFTVRSRDGYELLVYQCAEDEHIERFLLAPVEEVRIRNIENNVITLREALTGGWLWAVDRNRDGSVTKPVRVNASDLPIAALPRASARLHREPETFLRLRLIGPKLSSARTPAHVVKRAAEGAMAAVKALASQVLSVEGAVGRPSQAFRQYYDLPALSFARNSFEIAFGYPDHSDRLDLGDTEHLAEISRLFREGLDWATKPAAEDSPVTAKWSAILDALSAVAPPQHGDIESVQVSGAMAGSERPIELTRDVGKRISSSRQRMAPSKLPQALEGRVRELDKDRLTFILRAPPSLERPVDFDYSFFEEVSAAFENDEMYAVIVNERRGISELVSIVKKPPQEDAGGAGGQSR